MKAKASGNIIVLIVLSIIYITALVVGYFVIFPISGDDLIEECNTIVAASSYDYNLSDLKKLKNTTYLLYSSGESPQNKIVISCSKSPVFNKYRIEEVFYDGVNSIRSGSEEVFIANDEIRVVSDSMFQMSTILVVLYGIMLIINIIYEVTRRNQ